MNSSPRPPRSEVSLSEIREEKPVFDVEPMTDRERLEELLRLRWSDGGVFIGGRMLRPCDVEAVGAYLDGRLQGVATWRVEGGLFYMVTVNNITDQRGVATVLLERMMAMAREQEFPALRVVISNDNWPAFRFYQKRGFRLVALHAGIVDAMRRDVPSIPERGVEEIPMHDELELEIAL